jgi:hypothetical protein
MNIQYANYIEIIPAYAVSSISGDAITPKSGYSIDKVDTMNNLEPDETSEDNDAGVLYKFKVSSGVEKFTDTLKQKYGNRCSVILTIFQNDGQQKKVVGTLDNPVQMTWTPKVEHDSLSFSRNSIFAVL